VTFMLDRAGLTGPDGPTHHGAFDLGYLRVFPNMVVMSAADEHDLSQMLDLALRHDGPCAIRYPKGTLPTIVTDRAPVEFGKSEVLTWSDEGAIICCGAQLSECLKAADSLRDEGIHVGVINARFVKPLDSEVVLRAVRDCGFVVTVEEASLMGGFGSAVLEVAADAGLNTSHIRRLGIPDKFIEHGERGELLTEFGLDAAGIAKACRACDTACGAPSRVE
jgi:1-deoxy-D-xylulose-5-phosphate synthase